MISGQRPCYFLAVVDNHDRQRHLDYSKANVQLLSGLDVTVLAATDDIKLQDGESDATTVILLKFANDREVNKWFDTEQYTAVKPIRLASSTAKFANLR